ncbi:hypothetical protein ACOZ4N_11020 [Halorientalis pallida]|uniref:hypothetical protein n=1 Tax=Halorientalis pallida TaxID=2479928 RepID=UPI003C705468
MPPLARLGARPAVALGTVGLALGVAVGGIEGAALGGLIGFFLGKSLRSAARTFAAGR